MDISHYLNKKNSFRELSDEDFEHLVPLFAQQLENSGFIYDSPSPEDIQKDWKSLCKKTVVSVAGTTATTTTNNEKHIVISATCVVGMKIIRKYMPHFYNVKNYKGVSVISLWKKENVEKALRFNRKYHSTPYVSEIIRSLSFTNGLGKITIYRPIMAKNIVSYLNAQSVLDVCVGWGGRMLGSVSVGSNVHYTGIEPCMATYEGLCQIRDTLSLDNIELINKPAELALEQMPKDRKFDMALTSPPYYNLEIYSDEHDQSLQYGSYEQWIHKFLEPVIAGVLGRVKCSCWSIKNFKTNKKYALLEDVIQIHEKNGWKMMDITFSMTNSKRPGGSAMDAEKKASEETTYLFIPM